MQNLAHDFKAPETRDYPLQIKAVDEQEGTFSGYLSVFGVTDSYGDVVERGAFKRTLKSNKGEFPLLWFHSPWEPIGGFKAKEDEKGLWIDAALDLELQLAREKLSGVRKGYINGLSIGYETIKQLYDDDGARRLKELKLYEGSLITKNFQATPGALISSVKSVVPYQNLPLGDREADWDKAAAEKRVRSWAGIAEQEDLEDEDKQKKFQRGWVYYKTGEGDKLTSYKLLIADIVDGKLTAIPRAIFAAAAAVMGARGGVDIPDGEMGAVRAHLGKYYSKMDLTPPWSKARLFKSALSEVLGFSEMCKDGSEPIDGKLVKSVHESLGVLLVSNGYQIDPSGKANSIEDPDDEPAPAPSDDGISKSVADFISDLGEYAKAQ